MSEKLCLQWNDFKQNVNSAFGKFRDDKEFTNVTLVCEDGQQTEAHKVILASSSPFFEKILHNSNMCPVFFNLYILTEPYQSDTCIFGCSQRPALRLQRSSGNGYCCLKMGTVSEGTFWEGIDFRHYFHDTQTYPLPIDIIYRRQPFSGPAP